MEAEIRLDPFVRISNATDRLGKMTEYFVRLRVVC
jgi:hypothetical protein